MKVLHVAISRGWHAQISKACEQINCQHVNSISTVLLTLKNSRISETMSGKNLDLPIYLIKHHESPSLVKLLIEVFDKENPDLIHIHGENGLRRLWLAKKLSNSQIPVIMSTRDMPKKKPCRNIVWKVVDRVIVPNNLVKNYIKEKISAHINIDVLSPMVDTEKFQPVQGKNSVLTIAMFARYAKVKGFKYFFEACGKLVLSQLVPECRFVIAGTNFNIHMDEIKKMINNNNLDGYIKVLGKLKNIEKEISRVDIGVIASVGSEELSRIALEYMSCGIPVIATKVGGLPECIGPDEGILVEPASTDALYKAMLKLYNDSDLRKRLGSNARKRALSTYSEDNYINKIHEIYSKEINTKKNK